MVRNRLTIPGRWLAGVALALLAMLATLVVGRRGGTAADPAAGAASEPPVDRAAHALELVAAGVGKAYPGAAVAFGSGATVERVEAIGRIGWRAASPPVLADSTIYDLASVTKALATTTAVLLLVEDGRIGLDDPVQPQLPGFEGRWKERVTWRHLLTHTSGLPPGTVIRGATPAERRRRLLRTRLAVPPGHEVSYSDIGYVVLWAAAERAAGEPLTELLRRRVWEPLGMTCTGFMPGRGCEACAPTLRLRTGEPFRGEPADLLARQLGGVAGHAGLFSTVADAARFAALMAAGGELDGVRVLDASLVAELFRQQPRAGRRTLGWTAFCPDEPFDMNRPCEHPVAFGHSGWTGTSLWIDPASGRWVVLLTNRSYERADRPFPLDALRRDLFLTLAGTEAPPPADRWLARPRTVSDSTSAAQQGGSPPP